MPSPSDSTVDNEQRPKGSWLSAIGPGLLVAATGVGAGDLATGAFTGGKLGTAVLWAVIVGALLKYFLNEGLARWQLATGTTLLEGTVSHLGWVVQWVFLLYLLAWSYFVGAALMSAVGVTFNAIWPLFDEPKHGKIVFGVVHSVLAVGLVKMGGYRLFEKVMSACIAIMFVVVVVTAGFMVTSWGDVFQGMFVPTIPQIKGEGLVWTVALMGGVGGTVTVLCYGYWIREEGRNSEEDLRTCRIDLAVGYSMTALFGIAMVIIGQQTGAEGKGASLIVGIADTLYAKFGGAGTRVKWLFLIGAWGAVFSSLLGVWQSIPYLFADFCRLLARKKKPLIGAPGELTRTQPYSIYLLVLALLPAAGMLVDFETAQKVYAVVGAFFIPLLAVLLLVLNSRTKLIGTKHRNGPVVTVMLIVTVLFFGLFAYFEIKKKLAPKKPVAVAATFARL